VEILRRLDGSQDFSLKVDKPEAGNNVPLLGKNASPFAAGSQSGAFADLAAGTKLDYGREFVPGTIEIS